MSGEKKLLQQPFVVVVKHVPNSGRVSAEKDADNRKEAAKLAAEQKANLSNNSRSGSIWSQD